MLTGIDHVIVVVSDLDAAAAELEGKLGLAVVPGGRHAAHGTANRLVWLGDSYIELMGVVDRLRAAGSWWGSFALRQLDERGDGLAGVVLATDALEDDTSALRAAGSTLGDVQAGERIRPDGRAVRWRAAMPPEPDADLGLAFLIEHDTRAAEWTPIERAERAQASHPIGGPVRLRRLELSVADMRAATMRIHRQLGVGFRPALVGAGARDGTVARQTLRLLRRGPTRIVLGARAAGRRADALGCEWVVEPAAVEA